MFLHCSIKIKINIFFVYCIFKILNLIQYSKDIKIEFKLHASIFIFLIFFSIFSDLKTPIQY